MSSSRLGVLVLALLLLTATLLGGCESTHQHLLAGLPARLCRRFRRRLRQRPRAAGSIRRIPQDVPRYLRGRSRQRLGRRLRAMPVDGAERGGGVSRSASGTIATTIGSATATARWPEALRER